MLAGAALSAPAEQRLMAAANASPCGQRRAVLSSLATEFVGWRLAIDCGGQACGGERAYTVAALVALYGQQRIVS